MTPRSLAPAFLSFVLLSCGTAPDGSDAGEQAGGDGGDMTADAGGADAGSGFDPLNPQTWPNAATWGNWQMAGLDSQACDMNFASGFSGVGATETGRYRDFKLTLAPKWNEQTVVLQCALAEGTTGFTCVDWTVTMGFNGCVMNGSLRSITGRLEHKNGGVEVEIEGTIATGGQGATCPAGCGPEEISAIGTVLNNN